MLPSINSNSILVYVHIVTLIITPCVVLEYHGIVRDLCRIILQSIYFMYYAGRRYNFHLEEYSPTPFSYYADARQIRVGPPGNTTSGT